MHWIINVFVSVIVFVQSLVGGGQTVTPVVTSNVVVSTTTQSVEQSAGTVSVKTSTKVVQDGVENTPIDTQSDTVFPPSNTPPVVNIQVPPVVVQQNQTTAQEPVASAAAPKQVCDAQPIITMQGHEENPITVKARFDVNDNYKSITRFDNVWLYTPCSGQKWYADFIPPDGWNSKDYDYSKSDIKAYENGKPDSGKYKGLVSYVVQDYTLPTLSTTTSGTYTSHIIFHSPDSIYSATTTVILVLPVCDKFTCDPV